MKKSQVAQHLQMSKQEKQAAFEQYRKNTKSSTDMKCKMTVLEIILLKYYDHLRNVKKEDHNDASQFTQRILMGIANANPNLLDRNQVIELRHKLDEGLKYRHTDSVKNQILTEFKSVLPTLVEDMDDHGQNEDQGEVPDNPNAEMIAEGFYNMLINAINVIPANKNNPFLNTL